MKAKLNERSLEQRNDPQTEQRQNVGKGKMNALAHFHIYACSRVGHECIQDTGNNIANMRLF
jgi:hypothetical protein